MSSIIEKIKEGYKLCVSNISDDCLKIAKDTEFTGSLCIYCFKKKQLKECAKLNKKRKKKIQLIIEQIKVPSSDTESDLDSDLDSEISDKENEDI